MPAVRHRLVGTTVRDRVLAARLRGEEGFGLIELLIAMLVMALGIMAIVAGFSSGMVALGNASRTGTAGTLADKQMEAYRALPYANIALTARPSPRDRDATYTGDRRTTRRQPAADATAASWHRAVARRPCMPVQTPASGLDARPTARSYRLDTYIAWSCAGRARPHGRRAGAPHVPASSRRGP